jgi:hypothetical protein
LRDSLNEIGERDQALDPEYETWVTTRVDEARNHQDIHGVESLEASGLAPYLDLLQVLQGWVNGFAGWVHSLTLHGVVEDREVVTYLSATLCLELGSAQWPEGRGFPKDGRNAFKDRLWDDLVDLQVHHRDLLEPLVGAVPKGGEITVHYDPTATPNP